jgi:hypothetical protein
MRLEEELYHMLEINRGVPIPPPPMGRGSPRLYPFPDMQIGDSFFIPAPSSSPDDLAKVAYRAYFAVSNWRRKHPETKFTVRRMGDRVGVWRVA